MSNITGLFFRPFQFIGLMLSYITPRNNNRWCFGSSFSGNAKYLFVYMSTHTNKECVWIGDEKEVSQLRSLGLRAQKRLSWRGLYSLLTAGVYVFNSYVANVSLYTMGRAKRVNLWHGVGLKNIEYKIKVGPIAKRYHAKGLFNQLRYMNFRIKPDVFLSTSPMMTKHFSSCFEIDESKVIEGIYPRCEILTQGYGFAKRFINDYENDECKSILEKIKNFTYTYIYMPTFRDNGGDFLEGLGFDLEALNEALKQNERLLILKLHPDTKMKIDGYYSNIIQIGNSFDLYPVLPFTNCLITDYSSIYFDYILMRGKHVILFTPDYNDYICNSRDLAYSYDEYMKGIKANDFRGFLEIIKKPINEMSMPDIEKIRKAFWEPQYCNMPQLVEGINKKLWS